VNAWKALPGAQRQAAGAALALAVSLLLPWYSAVIATREVSFNAFEAFSWVEAAVLALVGAVAYLLWSRTQGRAFHLPGGDGTAVTAAGGWAVLLIAWRLFDRPDADISGVSWGIFVALAAATALAVAGQRMRAAGTPEPPNPAEDPTWEAKPARRRGGRGAPTPVRPPRRRSPKRPAALAVPEWEGEPPEAPTAVTESLTADTEALPADTEAADPPHRPPDRPDRLF